MTNQQIAMRGIEASQVLDNPAFQESLKSLRNDAVNALIDCPIRDNEGRLLLAQYVKVIDKFEGNLRGMIENGKLAQSKIDIDDVRNESSIRRMMRKVG